jgi:hypothetical protein
MGRDSYASKTPLLEDEEQNIGNSAILRPQVGPNGPMTPSGTVIPQHSPPRIVNLQNGGSGAGQTTSLIMTARRIVGGSADNPLPGIPGPITGIVEFGNGGRSTRVEFDVPTGPFAGFFDNATSALDPQDGGVIVTVPTGVLRAYARYDNLLLAPLLNTNPPVSLAQSRGVTVCGPGGPLAARPAGIPAEPVLVQAMASYFSRVKAPVYKTIYCYVSDFDVPVAVPLPTFTCFALPAFTKSVRVLRQPLSAALDISLRKDVQVMDQFSIAGGSPGQAVDIIGQENIIEIDSHDLVADHVTFLAVVCEIGI